ncbi:MAG: dihydropyrimidinase [Zhenhengia sp.]|uniref:dihydropyrimidinase n=1 Tax=Zhenhengia sp. TaxID=2944208 RepID=UPI003992A2AF
MSYLIKGGIIAEQNRYTPVDILVEGNVIKKIGKIDKADHILDASGMILFPGFIDAHTHLDMDTGMAHTADDFESGTKAALIQGTTSIIDFATQNKGETLINALENWRHKTDEKCSCDYGFHMAITEWNNEIKSELLTMRESGITSFKLYMAYDALRLDDGAIYEILKSAKNLGGLVGVHCENGDLIKAYTKMLLEQEQRTPLAHPLSRPDMIEAEAISRFLDIAYMVDVPVHIVHLSTQKGLECIRRARKRGQRVYVETCPQYLLLDEKLYHLKQFESAKYVLSPPLRSKQDQEALWEGIQEGEIQTISTDHCAFNFESQKKIGIDDFTQIPNGIPGIEHRPQLIYSYGVTKGRLSLQEMAYLLSTHVAQLFGMYPQKGTLAVGSDADIVVWNPGYRGVISAKTQLQHVDYTPYEGFKVIGRAEHVFLRGMHVVEEGRIVEEKKGRYIFRKPPLNMK